MFSYESFKIRSMTESPSFFNSYQSSLLQNSDHSRLNSYVNHITIIQTLTEILFWNSFLKSSQPSPVPFKIFSVGKS